MMIQGDVIHKSDCIQILTKGLGDKVLITELPSTKETRIEFPEGEIMIELIVRGTR